MYYDLVGWYELALDDLVVLYDVLALYLFL